MKILFNIEEQLKNLPEKPGVYIMKNSLEEIIYVGKAISLKNRVRQYFQSSKNHSIKVLSMVQQINSFEYIVTDSELEALILECNLIKKHRPRYNVLLKDDKTYPYIKVTLSETYPRVLITRRVIRDGSEYFGPYTSVFAVKKTIEAIKKAFPIRTCNKKVRRDGSVDRPCLNYHIKQCLGPCTGKVSVDVYRKMIDEIIQILKGKQEKLVEKLEEEMKLAAEDMEFERAAGLRDQINSLHTIAERQKIISNSQGDQDIIAIAMDDEGACVQVFFVRGGKLIGRESFILNDVVDMEEGEILTQFIKQFYDNNSFIPKEILLQEDIEDFNIISQWLSERRGNKVFIRKPLKGEKKKLVKMVEKNALLSLEQFSGKIKRDRDHRDKALSQLKDLLGLSEIPHRIEAFDISNIQGTDSVGSMVVFEDGKPKKSDYRRFKIKWVEGPDDYGSMEEILQRRFKRGLEEGKSLKEKDISLDKGKFSKLPDILMIDGGQGHVQVAQRILDKWNLEIPICGMVKDDRHNTRGIFYDGMELSIDKKSQLFHMITSIQDESHRFALAYHQKLRGKSSFSSILDEIPGIGPGRKRALLRHYGGLEGIRKASIEELKNIGTMNEKVAKTVFDFFNQ